MEGVYEKEFMIGLCSIFRHLKMLRNSTIGLAERWKVWMCFQNMPE